MSEQIKLVVDRQNKHGTDFYYPVCELSKTLVKLKGNTKKVLTKSDMFLLSKQFDITLKEQKLFEELEDKEENRRDEKHGLYPQYEDISN